MYGPLLSVLTMGIVPVWGLGMADPLLPVLPPPSPPASLQVRASLLTAKTALTASGVIVADLATGQSLFERSADLPLPMASLTKLMTALIIAENHDLTEWVPIPADIEEVTGNKVHLPPGDSMTVGDLLTALLIQSANDAAITLARYHSGRPSLFVEEMNKRAVELGLTQTVFANPSGLDDPIQRSTARDLAWLATYVLRRPELAERMAKAGETVTTRTGETIHVYHTHALMHEPGPVVAGKTGTTDEAGQCLLSVVQEDERRYVVVLLRSADRYADMRVALQALAN